MQWPATGVAYRWTMVTYLLVLHHLLPSVVQAQGFQVWPVARAEVDTAPDGRVFTSISSHSINDSGQIAFAALTSLVVPGLFLFDRGELLQIAGQGDPAPGGGSFGLFGFASLNEQGQIAVSVNLTSGEQGIFLFDHGKITAIARSGDPTACGPFRALVAPSINRNAEVVFTEQVAAGYGTFLFDGTHIASVACPGDSAPGGGTFVRTLWPSMNNQGQVVFEAVLSSPRGATGIFLYEQGQLHAVARYGDPAPEGDVFTALYRPQINNSGQIAFIASGIGLIVAEEGKFRRILPYTDPDTGEVFGIFLPRGGRWHPFYLNDGGQIVFEGRQIPPGRDFRNGMFFFDGSGFRAIVYAGDLMPDPRGVLFRNFYSLALNNAGEVSFVSDGYPRLGENSLFIAVPDAR